MYMAVSQNLLSRGHGLPLIRALLVLKLTQVYKMSEGCGTTFCCVESRPMLYWIIGFYTLSSTLAVCSVAQLCPTLWRPHGLQPTSLLYPWEFSRQQYWSVLPSPPPWDLANPEIEPRSPVLPANSLPEKPKNTRVDSLSLPQGIFPTQELNRGLLHYRWILYQLSSHGSPSSLRTGNTLAGFLIFFYALQSP